MKITFILERLSGLLAPLRDSRLAASPHGLASVIFLACYLFAIYSVRKISSRDPGSAFFQPDTAYDPLYTAERLPQAEEFIRAADYATPFHRTSDGPDIPRICVGIPSIARSGVHYLDGAVGSLLQGVTQDERDEIHLIVFIADSEPTRHPAYQEPWLANLVDEVLVYNVSNSQMDHIKEMERDRQFYEKGLYDYTYLLKACRATNAAHMVIFEDDILAMDGWYHRTIRGIELAAEKSMRAQKSADFLYLRLFYTERYLGWNSEDWKSHTFWSVFAIASTAVMLTIVGSCSLRAKRFLTPLTMVVICAVAVPALIILFFAAGKVTVLPLPTGVNVMNNYGCCAQGLLFPHKRASDLIEWYEQSRVGYVDVLTEKYADDNHENRWAITPSVIQHVGSKSSKGGASSKKSLWNFRFELFSPWKLRKEHEQAAESMYPPI